VFNRLPDYQYFFPYFSTALQAVPFFFSDEPSLYATRVVSLCCGLVLVYCMYILGSWVSGSVTGLLSAALTLSAPFFAISGRSARIDGGAAAVGFVGLTLVLTNARRSWIRFVVGGFLPV
jgi:4-amino-4-deoxy-L-arabinose transferase-like glycosyltransferase